MEMESAAKPGFIRTGYSDAPQSILPAIGSTAGRGGHMPASYSERPANKRARDVTTTEEGLGPSVKRSRGAMTGKNISDSALEVQQQLLTEHARDVITTGEGPGPLAKWAMTIKNSFLR